MRSSTSPAGGERVRWWSAGFIPLLHVPAIFAAVAGPLSSIGGGGNRLRRPIASTSRRSSRCVRSSQVFSFCSHSSTLFSIGAVEWSLHALHAAPITAHASQRNTIMFLRNFVPLGFDSGNSERQPSLSLS